MMTQIDPLILLRAYATGIFPMAESADDPDIFWVEPKRRAVLPLDGFHLSRSLRKVLLRERFAVTLNRAFPAVIDHCAEAAEDRPETWINASIREAGLTLHAMGRAHSVECWENGQLAGGLYGIALGRAFFGESMFSRARDASKVALAWLVARMRAGGYTLLDCQFMTDHLRSLGAVEISAARYSSLLEGAVAGADPAGLSAADASLDALESLPAGFAPFRAGAEPAPPPATRTVSAPVSGQLIVQLLTQTS
jgi:leucyl/phenylalanyl-tRNA---protein transferase